MHTQIDGRDGARGIEAPQERVAGAYGCDDTVCFSRLPPFLRVILVTDGTVTRSLEAYFNEPIDVAVISQDEATSDRNYPQIQVARGDRILQRAVRLLGRRTRTPYAFAQSIITDRVSMHVRRKLVDGKRGIGEVLREDRLETYREILDIRRSDAGARAAHLEVDRSASVLSRTYKVFHDRRAAIQIEEVFPEMRFGPITPQAVTG